jgi:hypothetical protein
VEALMTSPEVAARRARCVQLRAAGVEWPSICDELGYSSPRRAREDLQRALLSSDQGVLDTDDRDVLVAVERVRLDELERRVQTVMRRASAAGEELLVLRSVDRLLRVAERRSMLLGLDSSEPKGAAGDGDSFDQQVARLFAEVGDSPAS